MIIHIPKSCEPYKNDIRRFVDAMLFKLDKNANKGRWEGLSMQEMQAKLSIEMQELNDAIKDGNTMEVILEAADVANFALIIASIMIDRGPDE